MGQKQQLIWDLPPIESFYLNAAIYDIEKFEAKKRIKKLSDMLEIEKELYIPVRKLSLGQRMKAELLAALIVLFSSQYFCHFFSILKKSYFKINYFFNKNIVKKLMKKVYQNREYLFKYGFVLYVFLISS